MEYRHVATSFDGTTVAMGEFEAVVHIFDLLSGARLAQFQSNLDFGGSRLAIDPNSESCAVASYNDNSVSLYDLQGVQLWKQRNVDEPQQVRFSHDGTHLLCSHSRGVVSQFDLQSGKATRFTWFRSELNGAQDLLESPYDERLVIDQFEGPIRVVDSRFRQVARIKRKTFAVLDFTFAPDFLCVTESTGPITCYHLDTGKEVWQLPFPSGVHALKLCYNEATSTYSAISWPYKKGGPLTLLTMARHNGEVLDQRVLPDAAMHAYANRGSRIVSTSGEVVDSRTGELLATLDD